MKYPSIESVWVREGQGPLIPDAIRQPEHNMITHWLITEKIDGTNIRLIFTEEGMEIRGRSDKADVRPQWREYLESLVDGEEAKKLLRHPTRPDWNVTVYGELFGPGINGGGKCSDTLGFRAFDVLYGEKHWADFHEMAQVTGWLGLESVPIVRMEREGLATLPHTKSQMDDYLGPARVCQQGGRMEGFVARPPLTLLTGRGERIITKLTYRDLPEEEAA